MATVWRARDERTREIVALKRLHPHVVADATARARLEREAAALRAVDHPAIVRPRDLIDDPEEPALVMDFVAGRPLDERIAEGPLPTGEAIAIAGDHRRRAGRPPTTRGSSTATSSRPTS